MVIAQKTVVIPAKDGSYYILQAQRLRAGGRETILIGRPTGRTKDHHQDVGGHWRTASR